MTDTVRGAASGTASSSTEVDGHARLAGVSGLVFAALFVAALVLIHRVPTLSAPDGAYLRFYANDGEVLLVAVGLYLIPLAGIAFLWHMTAIRALVAAATPTPSSMPHGLALASGVLFVAMVFAGSASVGAIALLQYRTAITLQSVDVARALTGVGYGFVFVFAIRAAGMFAVTTTTLLRSARVLPNWLAVIGYLLAAVLLISATTNPAMTLAFPAWTVLLGVVLLVRARRTAGR